jgi:hypothetical protein
MASVNRSCQSSGFNQRSTADELTKAVGAFWSAASRIAFRVGHWSRSSSVTLTNEESPLWTVAVSTPAVIVDSVRKMIAEL